MGDERVYGCEGVACGFGDFGRGAGWEEGRVGVGEAGGVLCHDGVFGGDEWVGGLVR